MRFTTPTSTKADVVAMIAKKAYEAGIDPSKALKIAKCESKFNHLAINPNSSAKGLFQIINKTFSTYCEGDALIAEDSLNCFIKLYKKYPHWWVCKG